MAYAEFVVPAAASGSSHECRFEKMMTGISLRHSDSVDVHFRVNGKKAVIVLPHAAFGELRHRWGRAVTDGEAIEAAGRFLERLLQRGETVEDRMIDPGVEETLHLAEQSRRS